MSSTNGHSTGDPAAVATARPVVLLLLLRYRPGVAGEIARIVHVVPLPPEGAAGGPEIALCGAMLRPHLVETVTPGHDVPCSLCITTMTPHGPVAWAYPPEADALHLCREVDVFGALRTALRDRPPES